MHKQQGQNLDKRLKREVHSGPQILPWRLEQEVSLGHAPVQTRTCIPAELQPNTHVRSGQWAGFYLCNYTPHSLRGAAESYTT